MQDSNLSMRCRAGNWCLRSTPMASVFQRTVPITMFNPCIQCKQRANTLSTELGERDSLGPAMKRKVEAVRVTWLIVVQNRQVTDLHFAREQALYVDRLTNCNKSAQGRIHSRRWANDASTRHADLGGLSAKVIFGHVSVISVHVEALAKVIQARRGRRHTHLPVESEQNFQFLVCDVVRLADVIGDGHKFVQAERLHLSEIGASPHPGYNQSGRGHQARIGVRSQSRQFCDSRRPPLQAVPHRPPGIGSSAHTRLVDAYDACLGMPESPLPMLQHEQR